MKKGYVKSKSFRKFKGKATLDSTTNSIPCKISGTTGFLIIFIVGLTLFLSTKRALDSNFITTQDLVKLKEPTVASRISSTPGSNEQSSSVNSSLEVLRRTKALTPVNGKQDCQLNFPSSCQLEPRLIKYWNERTDCFTSPLKEKSG